MGERILLIIMLVGCIVAGVLVYLTVEPGVGPRPREPVDDQSFGPATPMPLALALAAREARAAG